jgi:hypothetical protein
MQGEEQLDVDHMFTDLDIKTSYVPVDVDMNNGDTGNHSDDDDDDDDSLSDLTSKIHKVTGL